MPILSDSEQIKRVYLPSTANVANEDEKAFVDLDVSPILAGDSINLRPEATEGENGLLLLTRRIKGWNYTEQNGEPAEINETSVGRLQIEDFAFLVGEINGAEPAPALEIAEKKTSLDT